MEEDDIRYRHCSMPDCDYKEPRGSWMGAFVNGKFVCDKCYRESQTSERQKLDRPTTTTPLGG